ncbi:MAG: DUF5916 domain-containing protein [Candidatus Aminicenantaceae bacterium]
MRRHAVVTLLLVMGALGALTRPTLAATVPSIPRMSGSPKIDGILDNPFWEKEALKIDGFRQFTPVEKGDPSQKTEAYIGYDHKNLYIAFRCYDTDPQKIRASITNRDNVIDDDWILVFLDTFNEKRRAFTFIINPLGIPLDGMRIEEGGDDDIDDSWDAVFQSEGRIDEKGYTVEMAIPFKSIRFPDEEEKVWGVTLARTVARTGEIIIWPEMSRDKPGLLTQAQEMMIYGEVEKGKNFELMPFATSLKTKDEKVNFEPGINFKWGISSDLTLDMTLNPDYSQIEADAPQIDINRRFALYYPEKRPFFLEGMEIFRFPEIQIVYTRRILDPIAGAKVSGKLGRYTYSLLSAYDMNPSESLWNVGDGGVSQDANAFFNIFRMKADIFKESYIGFALTDKELTGGSYNRLVGVDGQIKFTDRFFFNFQANAAKTKYGEQESDFVPAVYGNLGYYSKYWGGGLIGTAIHPDFVAASGYVNRVDYRHLIGHTYFSLYPEKKFMSQIRFQANGGQRTSYHSSMLQDQWVELGANLRFTEFSQMNVEVRRSMEHYGGIDFNQTGVEVSTSTNLIGWMPFGFVLASGDSIFYDPDDPFLGYSNVYGAFLTLKPSNRLQIGVEFTKQTFWEERGGEEVYDYTVLRNRITYQLSKTLSLRAIVDYNHFYKTLYGSFLFSYVYRPGTVFFFGVDNDVFRNDLGNYVNANYSVFVKFSYWHRM